MKLINAHTRTNACLGYPRRRDEILQPVIIFLGMLDTWDDSLPTFAEPGK